MILKILIFCLFVAAAISSETHRSRYPQTSIPPPKVYAHLASKTTRYRFNFFQNIRRSYGLLDELEQRQIENLGWKPPHIPLTYTVDGKQVPIPGSAGEDFLFMNRKMIEAVNRVAQEVGSPWFVDGWDACPLPTDPVWNVPLVLEKLSDDNPEYANYLNSFKTDDFYNNVIVRAQNFLNDGYNLGKLTLGELGVKIEYELYTYFLLRFSGSNPIGYRKQSSHPTASIKEKWNNEDYDFLGDFYSAHVNPTYWKIAGWIEKQITKWRSQQDPPILEITWISTWEGGPTEAFEQLCQVAEDAEVRAKEDDDPKAIEIAALVIGVLALIFAVGSCGYVCMMKKDMKNRAVSPMRIPENRPLRIGDERLETGIA